jgi:monoamine oxidase
MSTPLYANIDFVPSLPVGKAELVASTRLGHYTKIIVTYSTPWWRDTGLSGAAQSFLGPASAMRDTSDNANGRFRLTGFIAGLAAEQFLKLDPAERREAFLNQVSRFFAGTRPENPVEYIEQQWATEEWSRGCPCPFTPPDVLTKFGEHLTTPHGHVYFAGTEMSPQWKGYMEGALFSGARTADEVAERLQGEAST